MTEVPPRKIESYHAHVYFDADTVPAARALREKIEAGFDIDMGRFHEKPVGPHPMWSYQVAFKPSQFDALIPWMALNRAGLTVFVHPNTGDAITDHSDYVMWLGRSYDLHMDGLN
ncbi:MAG: DOPA 4,5-dioxygenase family protein [Rhodospirillaceae bacterium]|jgi:aromatic ring-cleaving dioxygenase|nr:DOPA 4,5-dioxygenase family protein [Rhodospirillaceae bacterium]